MTLGVAPRQADLFRSTVAYCEGRVAPDSIYGILHRECFRLFPDAMFADLIDDPGRRSVPPSWSSTGSARSSPAGRTRRWPRRCSRTRRSSPVGARHRSPRRAPSPSSGPGRRSRGGDLRRLQSAGARVRRGRGKRYQHPSLTSGVNTRTGRVIKSVRLEIPGARPIRVSPSSRGTWASSEPARAAGDRLRDGRRAHQPRPRPRPEDAARVRGGAAGLREVRGLRRPEPGGGRS